MKSFEEFAATRMPGVLRFAAILAGDRATAEDLAQEVLIRAYSRWDRIGGLAFPELYVRKMMPRPEPGEAPALSREQRAPAPRLAVGGPCLCRGPMGRRGFCR